METEGEGHDARRSAADVEAVGFGEPTLVPVRRRHDADERGPGRNDATGDLDVLDGIAGVLHPWGLVTEDLLDGVGDEARILDQELPLLGMVGEQLPAPADELGGGVVARAGEEVDGGQDLRARQPARGPGLVLELRLQQRGHQVVGGVLLAPFDVLGEHRAVEMREVRVLRAGRAA